MKFILIHGAFGSPRGNWFPELVDKLTDVGQEVIVPQFPVESWQELNASGPAYALKHQSLESWVTVIDPVMKSLKPNEKICFIGHSLGPLFILHVVDRYNIQLDSAIFVSPFLDKLEKWQFNKANETFYKTDFDFEKLKKLIPLSYVLYSDDDPYVSRGRSILFGKAIDSSIIPVKRAGHMNSEVNLNEFPLVLDLCMTRIDLSLYQRYLEHRKKQMAQEYIINSKEEGVLRLAAEEVVDEGIFHFRHLTKHGFCTLFTGLSQFWDPTSSYMHDSREAAKRGASFTRVIIYQHKKDLLSPSTRKQVELDLAAGIHIYLCDHSVIRDTVKDPDFGIWDDEYVCIVRQDSKTGQVKEAELNSRSSDITKYQAWKKYIISKSTLVGKMRDFEQIIVSA